MIRRRWAGRGLAAVALVAIAGLVGWLASDRQSSAPDMITEPEVPTTTLPAGSTSSLPAGSTSAPDESADVGITAWEEVDSSPIRDFAELGDSGGVLYTHGLTADDSALATSADGVEWTAHVLPDGLRSVAFAASSQRWAVIAYGGGSGGYPVVGEPTGGPTVGGDGDGVSRYPTVPTDEGPAIGPLGRVLVSDDQGASWTELEIEFSIGAGGSPYVAYGADIGDVAVVGSTVVAVVVANVTVPDYESLLRDYGVLDPGQQMCSFEIVAESVTFTTCDDATVPVGDPAAVFGADSDLIMSALRAEVVTAEVLTSTDNGPLQTTTTAEFGETASVTLSVVDSGFAVFDETSVQRSTDGLAWAREAPTGRVPRVQVEGPDGLWGAAGGELGDTSILHSRDGVTWEAVSTTTGFEVFELAAGSGGLAAVAASTDPNQPGDTAQLYVGVSPDGTEWDWQQISEVPGTENRDFYAAQVAVVDRTAVVLVLGPGAEGRLIRRSL